VVKCIKKNKKGGQTMQEHTMGSLFDGSGGFPLASTLCEIKPLWASEIEPFPIRVTRARFPNMKHYGDISAINGANLPEVDLITGGSPCQDMSIAGKRAGMSKHCPTCGYQTIGNADEDKCPECGAELEYTRSGLFMEQIRIIKEMRKANELRQLSSGRTDVDIRHIKPRFMLWENVCGAFSSNHGEDFRAVLEETARVTDPTAFIPRPEKGKWKNAGAIVGDGWSIAWRTLDAQYWGVPQRRRRIALVADFGGESAPQVLFERNGLSRNPAKSSQAWQRTTPYPPKSHRTTGTDSLTPSQAPQYSVDFGRTADRIQMNPDKSVTLLGEGEGAGAKTGLYCLPNHQQKVYGIGSYESNAMKSDNPHSGIYEADTARTIDLNGGNPACNQGGMAVVETFDIRISSEGTKNQRAHCYKTDKSRCLDLGGENPDSNHEGVCIVEKRTGGQVISMTTGSFMETDDKTNKSFTLVSRDYKAPQCVAYGIDRAAFNQEENAQYDFSIAEEQQPTMVAKGPGEVAQKMFWDGSQTCSTLTANNANEAQRMPDKENFNCIVEKEETTDYIVRRLTPLECSRLQGFPDWWCDNLTIENPTEEELAFWRDVFETHRRIVTQTSKPKTDKQIIKWLAEEPTDGAKYKMWGNGIALPCFLYVIEGIKKELEKEEP
jgi:DNA (cytosine-5)-methyltransferase 1